MLQRWRSLTFLHWPYPPSVIQRLLPPSLTVDEFGGAAWVGLVPFELYDLQPRIPGGALAPVLPIGGRFAETNVRTYVRGKNGERVVWFFTLDAQSLLAVLGARLIYSLPYRWARMSVARIGDRITYRSRRRWPWYGGFTDLAIEPGAAQQPDELAHFLTARFALYTQRRGSIGVVPIEHHRWSFQSARLLHLRQNLIEHCGIPSPHGEPVVHYSEDLEVKIGDFHWL